MPDPRRASCRRCGAHKSACGPISWSGLCQACAIGAVTVNVTDMHHLTGEVVQRWRRAVAASVGGVLLDEPRDVE
jgi:hypothetical protein